MHKLVLLAISVVSMIGFILPVSDAMAISSSLVITKVQAGEASSVAKAATLEYIEIYNAGASEVDITNWCLINKSLVKFVCFSPPSSNINYLLPAGSAMTVSSDEFKDYYTASIDFIYNPSNQTSGNIVGASDTISLIDNQETIIDTASWTSSLTGGSHIYRTTDAQNKYIDTDSSDDFGRSSSLTLAASGLYEKVTIIDHCPNLDGIQSSVPTGYDLNTAGDCVKDMCLNIASLQETVPNGYVANQIDICIVKTIDLRISELLPDAIGSDNGGEFIELYNNSLEEANLDLFKLAVGADTPRWYSFSLGSKIAPKSYIVIYNHSVHFTLTNSGTIVSLYTIDDQLLASGVEYANAKIGLSWANIDGLWQYTNQPTPGEANIGTLQEETVSVSVAPKLAPCASNQYRSTETNRCRLIVATASASSVTPCKDGQYRSEETNRCRTIKEEVAYPPCEEGYERNNETNRCRKIQQLVKAPYAVNQELIKRSQDNGQWVFYAVGSMAGGYGVWEWRHDAYKLVRRIRLFKIGSK